MSNNLQVTGFDSVRGAQVNVRRTDTLGVTALVLALTADEALDLAGHLTIQASKANRLQRESNENESR